ncbi:response receiver histidine kinase [Citrifermentans bemidjiense Bem]|uniref:histidine kinase n=1 Tax=Citrifermentans bemidjiense (strain ATCC BAA-1014 / DSM 16622 / JCM 12645 / Bem) TaxID=404380 RepID=B5E9B8_CITBB|nr:response regulator [Citrifermentans bemidjiense]ACH38660.1 response receiver histidine kinase [Citrifermentans bemidjiense Bem]
MKVLVVDDSRNDRKIIRYNFEWHGCEVLEASNGKQGLELAAAEKPDLIISDCLMPVMDGFQFLHEIKKFQDTKTIPFIFYSAVYTGSREAELAASLGARAFLAKPMRPEELWDEVGRLMAAEPAGEVVEQKPWPEEEFLKNYSQLVAGKLEEKVRELTETNESLLRLNSELERRVVERTSQLEAANRELDMFSYSISHDLRAPLRHLEGFSQALIDEYATKLNHTGKEYLERLRKSARRLTDMIDALLELSRHTRGKLVKESVDITSIAKEVAAQLARSQPERKVSIEVAEGMMVRGDTRLLKVVLEQVIGNAWKFTEPRGDEALVEVFPTELEGRPAYAVRDNGVGFQMEYADKLFSPFQRLHAQDEFPGRGIGLAIARRIITRHGGKIEAQAELGKGATFTFSV